MTDSDLKSGCNPVRSFCYENFTEMNDIYINVPCYLLEESNSASLVSSVFSLKFGKEREFIYFGQQ